MFVARRILIITNEMKFALNIKKALERNGQFQVAVFSSGKAGVDHVRSHEQDVAVVDFRMKDMPGTDMLDHLRTLQHDIAIIAAPNHPAIHDLKERYQIQTIINIPTSIRKFVTALESARNDMDKTREEIEKSIPGEMAKRKRNPQTLEYWLGTDADGGTVLEFASLDEPKTSPESSATFQQLAAEEPPMPTFIDGSTIRDLRDSLKNIDEMKRVLAYAPDDDTELGEPANPEDTAGIPAAILLDVAMDESNPIQDFTIREFVIRAGERSAGQINPLPSWKRKDERFVTEPDFLVSDLPFPEFEEAIEYTGTVTIKNDLNLEGENPGDWTTDPIIPVHRSRPHGVKRPPVLPEVDAPRLHETASLSDSEVTEHMATMGRTGSPPPLPPELPDLAVSQEIDTGLPYVDFDEGDPELAQLATTLTQVALELTADATVLVRDGQIVGYAGKLPITDLQGLLHEVTAEWDEASGSDKSRIVFAELPDSGEEFMISTRGTDAGFTLSLIFSGTRPLPDIRRQSKRLLDALATVTEIEPEPQIEPELHISGDTAVSEPLDIQTIDYAGVRNPVAYLWLMRDPDSEFNTSEQARLRDALDNELKTSGWLVGEIQALDYVYIYGEIPESLNPHETLNELMEKTAGFMDADAKAIWDDSFLIMQPGRELKMTEIQRFINFARR